MKRHFLKLSNEPSGSCPCCGETAFMFTVPGADGYVDACPLHALGALVDVGLLHEIVDSNDVVVDYVPAPPMSRGVLVDSDGIPV